MLIPCWLQRGGFIGEAGEYLTRCLGKSDYTLELELPECEVQQMPSPFPGMNPYLENPELWPEVHHRLITAIAIAPAGDSPVSTSLAKW